MALKKTNYFNISLEGYVSIVLGLLCTVIILLFGYISWQAAFTPIWLVALLLALVCYSVWLINRVKRTVSASFARACLQLDAISQEDYNQIAKAPFKKGVVFEFHQQLKQLSAQLLAQKSHYDQQAFLVYQLIAELDTPVLVFNAKHQLSYGNDAFSQLYQQPWQLLRHASAARLELSHSAHQWQFSNEQQRKKWQIKHSEFIDDGELHHLLVFINVEPVLRQSQLAAWQQLIRVLGHEIRNSLTPVSSMAETLANRASNEREKMALDVISERCHHLQSFVERYASVSKPLQMNKQTLPVTELLSAIGEMFTQLDVTLDSKCHSIYADRALLEQVLINIFKNAVEADATTLMLTVTKQGNINKITLEDNGQGFANLDNLFVPLYTTKPGGNGIGLSLCRNIIEQHGGSIALANQQATKGVIVTLTLPLTD